MGRRWAGRNIHCVWLLQIGSEGNKGKDDLTDTRMQMASTTGSRESAVAIDRWRSPTRDNNTQKHKCELSHGLGHRSAWHPGESFSFLLFRGAMLRNRRKARSLGRLLISWWNRWRFQVNRRIACSDRRQVSVTSRGGNYWPLLGPDPSSRTSAKEEKNKKKSFNLPTSYGPLTYH